MSEQDNKSQSEAQKTMNDRFPSQAEGDRETVEKDLEQKDKSNK